jgi:hypothetical protein
MKSAGLGLIIIGAKEFRFASSHRRARVSPQRALTDSANL